jgi:hypothetical protein
MRYRCPVVGMVPCTVCANRLVVHVREELVRKGQKKIPQCETHGVPLVLA